MTDTPSEIVKNITKVKLLEGGRKGVEIHFKSPFVAGARAYDQSYTRTIAAPVHRDLRNLFKDLREHLLRMKETVMPNDKVKEIIIAKTTVQYFTINDKGFYQLGGVKVESANKSVPCNSAFLKDEEYKEFDQLQALVNKIKDEAMLLMNDKKIADGMQVVVDYLSVVKEVSNPEEAYSGMTPEEQEDIMREAMENSGFDVEVINGERVIVPKADIPEAPPVDDVPMIDDGIVNDMSEPEPTQQVGQDDNTFPSF